jgi:hypothetical protein
VCLGVSGVIGALHMQVVGILKGCRPGITYVIFGIVHTRECIGGITL